MPQPIRKHAIALLLYQTLPHGAGERVQFVSSNNGRAHGFKPPLKTPRPTDTLKYLFTIEKIQNRRNAT